MLAGKKFTKRKRKRMKKWKLKLQTQLQSHKAKCNRKYAHSECQNYYNKPASRMDWIGVKPNWAGLGWHGLGWDGLVC